MEIKSKYCCHKCDRTVFNRRISVCEFCGSELPKSILIGDPSVNSKEQLDSLRARLNSDEKKKAQFKNKHSSYSEEVDKDRIELLESIMDNVDFLN